LLDNIRSNLPDASIVAGIAVTLAVLAALTIVAMLLVQASPRLDFFRLAMFAMVAPPNSSLADGTRGPCVTESHQTSRRNDIQVITLLGSQATGLANAEYDLTVFSLAKMDAPTTIPPENDQNPSRLANKCLQRTRRCGVGISCQAVQGSQSPGPDLQARQTSTGHNLN
jgi:hypothetical protein